MSLFDSETRTHIFYLRIALRALRVILHSRR